jgi:hypothetical protein
MFVMCPSRNVHPDNYMPLLTHVLPLVVNYKLRVFILKARCVLQPFCKISLSGIPSIHVAYYRIHVPDMPCNFNAMHNDEESLLGILHRIFGRPASRDLSSSLSKQPL